MLDFEARWELGVRCRQSNLLVCFSPRGIEGLFIERVRLSWGTSVHMRAHVFPPGDNLHTSGQCCLSRIIPQCSRAHREDDFEVAISVREKEYQDGGASC